MARLINYLSFYVIWIICLWSAVHDRQATALIVTLTYLTLHLKLSKKPRFDLLLIASLTLLGLIQDTILIHTGIIVFHGNPPITPIWLLCIWALFGSTLDSSLFWLQKHPLLAALFGAFGFPICYQIGVSATAATWLIPDPQAWLILALIWFFLFPALFYALRFVEKRFGLGQTGKRSQS
ncbi:MAG: DUF2878 domain-containing protein [Chlamydiia bacterium]|nr:DUF2878 domain-containing protein [Chlamydiia bacterium]